MAHETSIHRRDVESAVGATTPVAADLAVDGIDEVLALMLAGDWSDEVVPEASGSDGGPRGRRPHLGGHAGAGGGDARPGDAEPGDTGPTGVAARVAGERQWCCGCGDGARGRSADGDRRRSPSCASASKGDPVTPTRGAGGPGA